MWLWGLDSPGFYSQRLFIEHVLCDGPPNSLAKKKRRLGESRSCSVLSSELGSSDSKYHARFTAWRFLSSGCSPFKTLRIRGESLQPPGWRGPVHPPHLNKAKCDFLLLARCPHSVSLATAKPCLNGRSTVFELSGVLWGMKSTGLFISFIGMIFSLWVPRMSLFMPSNAGFKSV